MTKAGSRRPPGRDRAHPRGSAAARPPARVPGDRAPVVHARRREGAGSRPRTESSRPRASLARRSQSVSEVLVEESIAGWKEFELEVMRDHADNAVIVCSIENVDPMGVHTGDSVTVAPQQTLTDREYQAMRDDAIACLRAIGVETGGSNVQFAVDPETGRRVLIEMNPTREPIVGARVEGHGLPDREDRGAARRRLSTGRDPQRHHGRNARVVRADARLRRGEDPAVRLREVPGGRCAAHVHDEVRRRGDGDRWNLQGGLGEGVAWAREVRRRPRSDLRVSATTCSATSATAPSGASI